MKLAIVRQHYRPDGGAERFIARAISGLAQADSLRLSVIARNWQGDIPDNVDVISCNPSYRGRIAREESFAQEARMLWSEGQFELVQSHERISGCDIYRAGDGVHKVWLEQKSLILSKLQKWWLKRSGYHRYVLRAEEAMFRDQSLRAVICNSEMVRQEIISCFQVPAEKIHVIYNGVDSDYFSPVSSEEKRSLRKKLSIPDRPTCLYVGSGFERKGVATAILALSLSQTDAQLVIVGKDKKISKYRRLANRLRIADRVIFTGMQPDPLPFYQAADCIVHPALYDPFPNVILEGMAAGLPIITSKKCGGAEFIVEGESGFVTDSLDASAVANAIDELSKGQRYISMGKVARNKVKNYSVTSCAKQLEALYQHLLQGN